MSTSKTFLKTSLALAIAASLGVAHAQNEEKKQVQQPSSSAGVKQPTTTMPQKRDDTVTQTQQPQASGDKKLMPGNNPDRRDETVKQTQQANPPVGSVQGGPPTGARDDTVKQTQQPQASATKKLTPGAGPDKRDDTVKQTQTPSATARHLDKAVPAVKPDDTVTQTQTPKPAR